MDSSVWFNNEETYNIVEESMFQNNLGRVFTLLRKADEEDELDFLWDV